jgi:hypothetical protein
MEEEIKEWRYSILVDDHKVDSDYTEWTRPYWNTLVFKSYKEINKRLNEVFNICLSPISYYHNDCEIMVEWIRDRESTWEPLCFCNIVVVWIEENVKKIDKILENELPWIWDYLKK